MLTYDCRECYEEVVVEEQEMEHPPEYVESRLCCQCHEEATTTEETYPY